MKYKKLLYIPLAVLLMSSCGSDSETVQETTFYKKENVYDVILVLNYNTCPIIKNKGSAIFIHAAKRNYKKTEGCIALKKAHLLKLLKELKVSTKVKIENQK